MDWLQDALCRGKNHDMWYPPLDSGSPNDYYTLGKLFCHRCPVWKECLQSASNETWGMWGGLTPQERRGTVKVQHGTIESFRKGCSCNLCKFTHAKVSNAIDLAALPNQGATFDPKHLLYTLIES